MNPIAYLRVAELLAGLALIAGICWGVHEFLEHERDIGRNEIRVEYAQKLQEAKDAAKLREDELRGQVADAVNKGNDREQTIRTLATANGNASIGLRDTTAGIRNSLSSLSTDALRSVTAAYGNVLTECQSRRGEVAEIAERLNSEKQTLIDSWPKNERSR